MAEMIDTSSIQDYYKNGTWSQTGSGRVFRPRQRPAGVPAPPAPGAPAPLTNTVQNDPRITNVYDEWKKRLSADTTQRAIDKSNLGIRDAAALLGRDAAGGLARRGAYGSDLGAKWATRRITEPAQRAAAGAAADITLRDEARRDQLVSAGLPIATAQGNLSLGQQNLGLQQYATQGNLALNRDQLNAQIERDRIAQAAALADRPVPAAPPAGSAWTSSGRPGGFGF